MRHLLPLLPLLSVLLLAGPAIADVAPRPPEKPVERGEPPKNMIVLDGGTLVLGGAPTPQQLAVFADKGFTTVIDLRSPKEPGYEQESDQAKLLGMTWKGLPIAGAGDLSFANARAMLKLLEEAEGPVLLHCASGNRVGALFALGIGQIRGTTVDEAIAYGKARGLTRLEPVVRELLSPKPE
jgi:uncharacterized protein (TIGR01244 family)